MGAGSERRLTWPAGLADEERGGMHQPLGSGGEAPTHTCAPRLWSSWFPTAAGDSSPGVQRRVPYGVELAERLGGQRSSPDCPVQNVQVTPLTPRLCDRAQWPLALRPAGLLLGLVRLTGTFQRDVVKSL